MTRSRTWTLGTAVVVVLVLLAGWFLLVAPTRADAADVNAQTEGQQAQNAQLAAKIETLKVQAQDLPAQEAKLAKFRQQVPVQPGMPSFIRSLTSIGDSANVVVVAIEPQTPALLTPPATAATTPEPAAPADGSTPATLPAEPVSDLHFIQAQVTISGGYFNTEQFLTKLEGLKRAFLVTSFDIATDQDEKASSGDVVTHLQVRIFYAPTPAGTSTAPSTTATN